MQVNLNKMFNKIELYLRYKQIRKMYKNDNYLFMLYINLLSKTEEINKIMYLIINKLKDHLSFDIIDIICQYSFDPFDVITSFNSYKEAEIKFKEKIYYYYIIK